VWLAVSNYSFWFDDPFCAHQLFSWFFLFLSIYLLVAGVGVLRKSRKTAMLRDDKALFGFEKTTALVDYGIYKYIRHPMYASLLFLTWGICFKNFTLPLLVVAFLSSVFLYLTALCDEKECVRFFGQPYADYMKRSKRFIPFVV
jgi:protein-S-isoprenylcysteine O-methyltransferase Ste14